jgi:hypothetical protein
MRGKITINIIVIFFVDVTNTDIYMHTSIHPYKYAHIYPISISTSEKLNRFDLKIHERSYLQHLNPNGGSSKPAHLGTIPSLKTIAIY